MDVMAQRIGKTRYETEKLLGEAIEGEFVKGVIDRTSDEFVVQERETEQEHFVGACPNCGGRVDALYFPEEHVTCPYCERVVLAPSNAGRKIESGDDAANAPQV
jgi:DNA-directed RNA polymerase subunit RPC12/RpoP